MTVPLRTVEQLAAAGLVAVGEVEGLRAVAERYAVAISPAMAGVIRDPADPVALQFVPDARELDRREDEDPDPIGDAAHSPVEGIVHRYPDRVLFTPTLACAVYCRFCFRREVVGPGGPALLAPAALDRALAYISERPQIWEVILTGGDPLMLSARRIGDLMRRLAAIPHVEVIRLHTRIPVVDPERITPALVEALRVPGAAVFIGLHANHAREFTPAADVACARLIDAGLPMLSQTVLLKGVNDDADTLSELMKAFVARRIRPYYLHHLDRAPGTARFRVELERGLEIVRSLRGRISGLCQPTYVFDIPGGHGKAPLGPSFVEDGQIADRAGCLHPLPSSS